MSEPDPGPQTGSGENSEETSLIETEVTADVTETRQADRADPVVESRDLSVYYGDDQALNDVNLAIHEQEVTAIIGPSGCGKSTFLRCLNRMNDLVESARVEGDLLLRDTNLYGDDVDPVALRRQIGMVFQHPNPFPKTIYDNVAYGLRVQNKAVTDDVIEQALRRAAIWDEVKDQLHTSALDLSGGQQQRLCIARAIAVEDYTVVIVTHNMQQAARISDRTAVFLTGGELAEYDDTQTIFENPESERVEDYITGKFG